MNQCKNMNIDSTMSQCRNMHIDSTMPQCGNMHIDSTMSQCRNMHGDSTMPQCGNMQCYSDGGNAFSNCDNELNPSNIVNNNIPPNIVNNNNPSNIVNNDNQYQFITSNMTNLTKSMISSPPTPLSNPFGLNSRSFISSSSNTLSNGIGSSSVTPHICRQYTQPVNPEYGAILMASNMNPNATATNNDTQYTSTMILNAPKSHGMKSTPNKPQMILNTPKSDNPNNNASISSTIVPDNSAEIKTTNTNTNRHTNNQEDTTNINENTNNHTGKRRKDKDKRIFMAIPKDPFKSMKDIRSRSLQYADDERKQFYVLPEKFGGGMTKIVRYKQKNGSWSENLYCEYKHCIPDKNYPNEHGRMIKDSALRHMISAKHLKKWQLPLHCISCDGRWAWAYDKARHSCDNMKLKKYECVYCGYRYIETHQCHWAGFRWYDRIDPDTLLS